MIMNNNIICYLNLSKLYTNYINHTKSILMTKYYFILGSQTIVEMKSKILLIL